MIRRKRKQLKSDVLWGLAWGLVGAAGAAGFVWVVSQLARAELEAILQTARLPLHRLIAVYGATGVTGGLLLGVLRPTLRNPIGAVVTATLIAMLFYSGFFVLTEEGLDILLPISFTSIGVLLLPSGIVGVIAGYGLWRFYQDFEIFPGRGSPRHGDDEVKRDDTPR